MICGYEVLDSVPGKPTCYFSSATQETLTGNCPVRQKPINASQHIAPFLEATASSVRVEKKGRSGERHRRTSLIRQKESLVADPILSAYIHWFSPSLQRMTVQCLYLRKRFDRGRNDRFGTWPKSFPPFSNPAITT